MSPAGSQAQTWPRTQTRFLRKVRRSDLPCQDHLLYVGHTMMGRCSLLFTCLLPSFSPVSHHGPIFPSVCLSHTLSHTHMHAHTCTHTHTRRDTHRHTHAHILVCFRSRRWDPVPSPLGHSFSWDFSAFSKKTCSSHLLLNSCPSPKKCS